MSECPDCGKPTYLSEGLKRIAHKETGSRHCSPFPDPVVGPPGQSTNTDGSIDYRCVKGPYDGNEVRIYGGATRVSLDGGAYVMRPPAGRLKKHHLIWEQLVLPDELLPKERAS